MLQRRKKLAEFPFAWPTSPAGAEVLKKIKKFLNFLNSKKIQAFFERFFVFIFGTFSSRKKIGEKKLQESSRIGVPSNKLNYCSQSKFHFFASSLLSKIYDDLHAFLKLSNGIRQIVNTLKT